MGGDSDGGGAEDEERRPPRVPPHLLRRHEQGRLENTQKFTFPTLNCNIESIEILNTMVFNIVVLYSGARCLVPGGKVEGRLGRVASPARGRSRRRGDKGKE